MGGGTGTRLIVTREPVKQIRQPAALRLNLDDLARFLVKAKVSCYAGDGAEVAEALRHRFKELTFIEGPWGYRDSYAGFFSAPGQEVVRFAGEPIWVMSYSGGMTKKYLGDVDFATQTFTFLKEALAKVRTSEPFRGPSHYHTNPAWTYECRAEGDITSFRGQEQIIFEGKTVFAQDYIGGLVMPKLGIRLTNLKSHIRR